MLPRDAAGPRAPGPASTDAPADRLRDVLAAERAAAAHWRRIARQHGETLDALRRRPGVRAVLALGRRTRPLRDRLVATQERLTDRLARIGLILRSLPTRRALPARRERLARTLAELPATHRSLPHVSIVTVADGTAGFDRRVGSGSSTEVIVVRTGAGTRVGRDAHRVIDGGAFGPVAAAALGADAAHGELLCFLAPTTEPLDDGWLDRLAAEIRGATVAATPMLVHPERPLERATPDDLQVRMFGIDLARRYDGVPVARSREAGSDVSLRRAIGVAAGSAACLVVDRKAYEAAGGLGPSADLDAAAVDLCRRLRARGGAVVAVGSSIAADHRATSSVRDLASPIDDGGPGWRALIEQHGPALVRSIGHVEREALTFTLTTAAPSAKIAHRWGDWHLAHALGRSLRRLGHPVRVQTADHADDLTGRSSDIHVVLHGLAKVRRTSGQRHVLWVISHPEQLDVEECDEADLVLVASDRFARELRERTSTPVEVLLQATDHGRFRPLPPDPARSHPIVVVAKTREVMRPAVADALAAGFRPAIYGSGWEHFVDPDLVVADTIANEELPVVYSSAGVVLNDHWETMRSWGFVSNRLFDVLACASPVISDHLPEVHDVFGDAVPTYRNPEELRTLVDADLGDRVAARDRASAGRAHILAAHTFDHRARELLDALIRYQLS